MNINSIKILDIQNAIQSMEIKEKQVRKIGF